MDLKHNYLLLLVALILAVAVVAGIFVREMPVAPARASPSGTFAIATCDELNNLFMQNNCYGPGDYDGYTCMKLMEARYQRDC